MSKNRLACVLVRDIKNFCANVVVSGALINCVTSSRYLGVYLESCTKLKCSFSSNKSKFYMAFNSLFGKIGRKASEEVLLNHVSFILYLIVCFSLIKAKCLPVLLYGVEACPTNSADKQSLQFTMNRVLFKNIFGAMAKDSYLEISSYFGIYPLEQSIAFRGDKFSKKYSSSDNYLCRLIAKH